jgi:hypothetical protein
MKPTRAWLLLVGVLLLSLLPMLPLTAAAATDGLEQPDALRTHGWICYTHSNPPYMHVCVP